MVHASEWVETRKKLENFVSGHYPCNSFQLPTWGSAAKELGLDLDEIEEMIWDSENLMEVVWYGIPGGGIAEITERKDYRIEWID